MTRKDKMIIRAARGSEDLVVRVPFGAAAAAAETRHAAALARLALSHPGLAPQLLAAGRINGFDYQVETALPGVRSEEHTSELQSLMRISYAVFCLKKKTIHT